MLTGKQPVARLQGLRSARIGAQRRQQGAIALLAAIWLSIAIAALGAIDIGNLFFVRRDLQRAADLAASAAAQTIGSAGGCAAATASAQGSATANGLPATGTVVTTCGRWDPSANPGGSYFVSGNSPLSTPLNAAQVTVSQSVPYFFFGPARALSATATAQATNIGAFSLTTSLAQLSGGAINGLLNSLLGTSLSLSVASYQGLAATQVTLQNLAVALGVGSISELLNAKVTVGQLATALLVAAGQGTALSASVSTALGTIVAAIPPGTQISISSILSLGLGDPQAGASASIGVLDALIVAAEVANGSSTIDLGAALNLGPIATVSAQAKVIEPPIIAVGEAGLYPNGKPRTTAHSAQVRVYLNIQLLQLNLGIVSISALSLPIYIEAANGTAYLQSTQCSTSKATSQSVVVARAGVATICVGNDAAGNLTNTSTTTSCLQPVPISHINVLGIPLLGAAVGDPSQTPPTGLLLQLQAPQSTTLTFNAVVGDGDDYQSTNVNAVGGAVNGILTQVVSQLATSVYVTVLGIPLIGSNSLLSPLLSGVLGIVATLLSPVLNSLDAILVPLLQVLGVQIGVSTVHDLGLACGVPQLVY
ncbi:pilus assembly protein TadG-related protein [Paraburkholderia acidicola]|uniref:Pilus assembly protein TadG-related protein n=1 Tax=Paraburkholderia acidicola TaxID=1912599 RepID=A0ABV1LG14_9BURK